MKKLLVSISLLFIAACSDSSATDGFKIIEGLKNKGLSITQEEQMPAEIREKRNYPNVYQDNIGFAVATPARLSIVEKQGIELPSNCKTKDTSVACLDAYNLKLEFYKTESMRIFTCETKTLCDEVARWFEEEFGFEMSKDIHKEDKLYENQGIYSAKSGKAFIVIQGFYLPDEYIDPIKQVLESY